MRREKLAFLDVGRLARLRHGADEIGLAAQKGRRLQHVHHFGYGRDFCLGVHIGQYRNAQFPLHLGQNAQAGIHAGAAEAAAAAAVGLVVAALEDKRNAQGGGDFLELARHVHLQLLTLDHAGAGDEKERPIQSDIESAQFHAAAFWCASAALM